MTLITGKILRFSFLGNRCHGNQKNLLRAMEMLVSRWAFGLKVLNNIQTLVTTKRRWNFIRRDIGWIWVCREPLL